MTDTRALPPEALAALAERAEKAIKGPWSTDVMYVVAEVPSGRPGGEVIIQCFPTVRRRTTDQQNMDNAVFIAAARSDMPALLAHAAYLAERLAEAEREIDRLVNKLQCPANARDDE